MPKDSRTNRIRHLVRLLSILLARLDKHAANLKARHHAWLSPVVFDLILMIL
jgi:hypothetical protein